MLFDRKLVGMPLTGLFWSIFVIDILRAVGMHAFIHAETVMNFDYAVSIEVITWQSDRLRP